MSEVAELQERLRYDTPFWAENCAKILDKRRLLVPLVPHPWQRDFDRALEDQRAKGLPMRAIVLKARKLGFSTWVAAKFLQRLTQIPDQHAVVVAQDTRTAGEIHNMAMRIYSHLPTMQQLGLGFNIKPDVIGANFSRNGRKFISFGERNRRLRLDGVSAESVFEIDTAGAPESGRGFTYSMAHLSEVARWPESSTTGPQSKMLSTLNAVPYVPETIVVLESTANGLNFFYRRWVSAEQGQEDPETGEAYIPVFCPWWRDPECAMPFDNPGARERFVESIGDTQRFAETAEDEPMLAEMHGCTPEQLAWRRMMIRTQHDNKVELFKQENPATPEEAFILSGRPFFSSILVAKCIREAEKAQEPVLGTLRATGWDTRKTRGGTIQVPTGAAWVPREQAKAHDELLEVWEHPVTARAQAELPMENRRPDGAYVAFVDVAEGAGDTFLEGDFHALSIWDHRTRMQVAQWESRIDRHLVPLWVLLCVLYYNRAWLAVEVNSVGVAVNDPLAKDFKYPRLYRRERVDSRTGERTEKVGWKTAPETKPLMEAAMGAALESDIRGGIRSVRGARQLTTYVQDEKGRRGALPGEHDDLLMTYMGAHKVMEVYRPPKEKKGGGPRPRPVVDDVTGY